MIIGVTGWFAAGKDTVADYLVEKCGFKSISLSDIIREELRKEGKELTRDNMMAKGNELRDQYGPEYLAKQALKKMTEGYNYVVPSVRQPAEVTIMRQEPGFELWNIAAPAELRHKRMLVRARSEDEKNITFEEFLAKEEREKGVGDNCQKVDKVIELSDRTVDNAGTMEELFATVDNILKEKNAQV